MKHVVQERDPANVYDLIRYICDGALNAKMPFTLDIDPISCGVHIQVGSINICSKNDKEKPVVDADSILCGACPFAGLSSMAYCVKCSLTGEDHADYDTCNCKSVYTKKITEENNP